MANYKNKLANLKSRRQDNLTRLFSVSESFNKNQYGESTTYALEAMEPISETYTQNTYKACDKIKSQLTAGLLEYGISVDFRYQGSVPTNTHIKNYSDVDLLSIHQSFYTLEPPQQVTDPYLGDPLEDLKNLRRKTFRILDTVYTACDIDDTGSKCINIAGGSLNRKIDIILRNAFSVLCPVIAIMVNVGVPARYSLVAGLLLAVCVVSKLEHTKLAEYRNPCREKRTQAVDANNALHRNDPCSLYCTYPSWFVSILVFPILNEGVLT